jgi:DNA-binding NarL/FixJ family response regulator
MEVNKYPDNDRPIMIKKSILALLVTKSDTLQNGLLALITTIPQISAVLAAEEISSALRLVENHQPALIILDIQSSNLQDVIKEIKILCNHAHVISISENISQSEELKECGADSVLIKGFPAHQLIEIIEGFDS